MGRPIGGRLVLDATGWTIVSFLAFGLVAAIIPNPVFGRQVPPTAASIWIWIMSAPLMGLVLATYTAPLPSPLPSAPGGATPLAMADPGRGSVLGTVGSLGAFLAIGCPVCNKVALVLLGASGALSVWAPIQPYVGGASLALLAATLAWRLRIRARGGSCPAR